MALLWSLSGFGRGIIAHGLLPGGNLARLTDIVENVEKCELRCFKI